MVLAARMSLSQSAVLGALEEMAQRPPDRFSDWQRVHAYALELADPAVDPRIWADEHVDWNEQSHHWGMLEPAAREALLYSLIRWDGACTLDDRLFTEQGAPVGPLASLALYSTDFSAWDPPEPGFYYSGGGKAHAPGLCQYSDRIMGEKLFGQGDDAMSYGDFLPRLAAQRRYPGESWVCSKCGGITMRLLSDEQLQYLERVRLEIQGATGTVTPMRRW